MINWPKELIENIARRRSVIYLGSGVSMNSQSNSGRRPKTWAALLNGMLDNVPNPKKTHLKVIERK
jgi:hypothetical protein